MGILESLLEFLTIETVVVLTAATPVIELRGAIPAGVALGLSPWHAFFLGVIGSMIPVPFILWTIRPILKWLSEYTHLKDFIAKMTHRTLKKSDNIAKYGFWGLLIFVAIPLPGTGVWSGALAAVLLDLRFKSAFPAILIGNCIAGFIMMTFSHVFFMF